jgi:hypothetical protein
MYSQDVSFLKSSAQSFMNSLVSHTELQNLEVVKRFIESEFQFVPPGSPKAPGRKKKMSSGFRFFSALSPSSPTKDIDSFFEDAQVRIGASLTCMKQIGRCNERVGHVEIGTF